MDRKQLLTDLRKYVEEGKNTRYWYVSEGCYCAVGYVFHKVGIQDDVLENLQQNPIIPDLYRELVEKYPQLESAGISRMELSELQDYNDNDTKEDLLEYIDKLLEQ